jgi:hypothetical protein
VDEDIAVPLARTHAGGFPLALIADRVAALQLERGSDADPGGLGELAGELDLILVDALRASIVLGDVDVVVDRDRPF